MSVATIVEAVAEAVVQMLGVQLPVDAELTPYARRAWMELLSGCFFMLVVSLAVTAVVVYLI